MLDLAAVHRQFPAVAEYLSNIYIIQRDYGEVRNSRLAAWVGVSGSAVTQAMGRLKRLGLAHHRSRGLLELTEEGRKLALKVLRRHYLLEHLLVRILDFPWDRADEEARRLQDQISDDLTEHLDATLGHPQVCPHGNPMPGASVETKLLGAPRLSQAEPGRTVRILRITEEGEAVPSMLALCYARGIRPGARFRILGISRQEVVLELPESPGPFGLPLDRAVHIRYEPDQG